MAAGRDPLIRAIIATAATPIALALGGGASEVSFTSTMAIAICLDGLIGNQNSLLRSTAYLGAFYNLFNALQGDPIGQMVGTGMTLIATGLTTAHLFFGRAEEARAAEADLRAHGA